MKVDSEAVKVGRFDEFYSLIVLITEYSIPNVDNYLVMNPFFWKKDEMFIRCCVITHHLMFNFIKTHFDCIFERFLVKKLSV